MQLRLQPDGTSYFLQVCEDGNWRTIAAIPTLPDARLIFHSMTAFEPLQRACREALEAVSGRPDLAQRIKDALTLSRIGPPRDTKDAP